MVFKGQIDDIGEVEEGGYGGLRVYQDPRDSDQPLEKSIRCPGKVRDKKDNGIHSFPDQFYSPGGTILFNLKKYGIDGGSHLDGISISFSHGERQPFFKRIDPSMMVPRPVLLNVGKGTLRACPESSLAPRLRIVDGLTNRKTWHTNLSKDIVSIEVGVVGR
jgi:hypothetical protein